jgi:hypothetical protein
VAETVAYDDEHGAGLGGGLLGDAAANEWPAAAHLGGGSWLAAKGLEVGGGMGSGSKKIGRQEVVMKTARSSAVVHALLRDGRLDQGETHLTGEAKLGTKETT